MQVIAHILKGVFHEKTGRIPEALAAYQSAHTVLYNFFGTADIGSFA
jgi:hypothetical protein